MSISSSRCTAPTRTRPARHSFSPVSRRTRRWRSATRSTATRRSFGCVTTTSRGPCRRSPACLVRRRHEAADQECARAPDGGVAPRRGAAEGHGGGGDLPSRAGRRRSARAFDQPRDVRALLPVLCRSFSGRRAGGSDRQARTRRAARPAARHHVRRWLPGQLRERGADSRNDVAAGHGLRRQRLDRQRGLAVVGPRGRRPLSVDDLGASGRAPPPRYRHRRAHPHPSRSRQRERRRRYRRDSGLSDRPRRPARRTDRALRVSVRRPRQHGRRKHRPRQGRRLSVLLLVLRRPDRARRRPVSSPTNRHHTLVRVASPVRPGAGSSARPALCACETTMLRNIGSNWVLTFVTIAATYVLTPITIHTLGQDGYGTWTLITAMTGYMSLLALGVPMACVRYLAEHVAERDPQKMNEAIGSCAGLYLMIGVVAAAIGVALAFAFESLYDIPPALRGPARLAFVVMALQVSAGFIGLLPEGIMFAHHDFVARNVVRVAAVALRLGLT